MPIDQALTIAINEFQCTLDILPGYLHKFAVTILTGPPYVGKSRFVLWICYMIAMGLPCFWGQCEPLRVLYCTERSLSMMLTQMKGLGLNLPPKEQFMFYTLGDMTPEARRAFKVNPLGEIAKIASAFKPHLVILDTMVHFLPKSETKNVNDYGSMTERILDLQVWAYNFKTSVLAIHHTAKEKEGQGYARTLEKGLGSQAIPGGTVSAWNLSQLEKNEDSLDILLQVDTHMYTKPEDAVFHVLPNMPLTYIPKSQWDLDHEAVQTVNGPLQKTLLELIPEDGEITRAEIHPKAVMRTGSDPKNVHKAINTLIEKKMIAERREGNVRYIKRLKN